MKKLFLTLCVLIFVIVGYGCDEPALSPSVHDNYTVIEFSFDELLKLPWYAPKVLNEKDSFGTNFYSNYAEVKTFFEEYVGVDVDEYYTQQMAQDYFVVTCARYGYDKTNYRYSNFTLDASLFLIDRTVLDPSSNAAKDFWLDLIIVPRVSVSGEKYKPGRLYTGSVFSEEKMGE